MTKLTTDSVRYSYSSRGDGVWRMVELDYEFDRWLASVKAEAWDQGADAASPYAGGYLRSILVGNPYRD